MTIQINEYDIWKVIHPKEFYKPGQYSAGVYYGFEFRVVNVGDEPHNPEFGVEMVYPDGDYWWSECDITKHAGRIHDGTHIGRPKSLGNGFHVGDRVSNGGEDGTTISREEANRVWKMDKDYETDSLESWDDFIPVAWDSAIAGPPMGVGGVQQAMLTLVSSNADTLETSIGASKRDGEDVQLTLDLFPDK